MSIATRKINDFEVKPLLGNASNNIVRGSKLFRNPYKNIICMGGKHSGKSNAIYRIMENIAHRCTVVIFASTVNNDPTYKRMIKMLKNKKKCNVFTYDHFIDNDNKINHLDLLIKNLQAAAEERNRDPEEKEEEVPQPLVNFGDKPKPKKEKPKVEKPTKKKPLTSEFIFIFDDLSIDMRDNAIYKLFNKNRHFLATTVSAIHNITDLKPGSWQNVDYILCFGNLPREKIDALEDKAGLFYKGSSKKNPILWNAYDYATRDKYNFLYIDRCDGGLRKNFNTRYILE